MSDRRSLVTSHWSSAPYKVLLVELSESNQTQISASHTAWRYTYADA